MRLGYILLGVAVVATAALALSYPWTAIVGVLGLVPIVEGALGF
ncbi:MAG: hypothetical protein ACE5HB_02045 [Terriglobia bacterium]